MITILLNKKKTTILSLLLILLGFLITASIYTALIMVIWNNVLLEKIKGWNLQKINFWDALAIGVFFSLTNI